MLAATLPSSMDADHTYVSLKPYINERVEQ